MIHDITILWFIPSFSEHNHDFFELFILKTQIRIYFQLINETLVKIDVHKTTSTLKNVSSLLFLWTEFILQTTLWRDLILIFEYSMQHNYLLRHTLSESESKIFPTLLYERVSKTNIMWPKLFSYYFTYFRFLYIIVLLDVCKSF